MNKCNPTHAASSHEVFDTLKTKTTQLFFITEYSNIMSSLQKACSAACTFILDHKKQVHCEEKNSGARSGGNHEKPQRALMRKKVATNAGRG
jgi:hypothetical protein